MTTHSFARSRIRRAATCAAALLLGGLAVSGPARAGAPVGPALLAYDYTNDHLVCFSASTPGTLTCDVALTGLLPSEFLVGIALRPATGEIYAVGTSPSGERVVTIDADTGAITPITMGFLSIAGGYFGMSFNPVVDRLRVVSNLDTSVRLNPLTGATAGADTNLAYAAGDPNEGVDPQVTHVAYTNSFVGATSTTLFGIDVGVDALVRIGSVDGTPVSPNTGQLTTIGSLGFDVTSSGGLDIDPDTGIAWAALRAGGVSRVYTVSLVTGAATLVGSIGSGGDFDGLALPEADAAGSALAAAIALLALRRLTRLS